MNAFAPQSSPEDEKLERELREFKVVGPRPDLKDRIRAEAAKLGVEPVAAEPAKKVVRFPIQTWIASAAAVVALGFGIALWLETQEKSGNLAAASPAEDEAGGAPGSGSDLNLKPYTMVDQVLVNQANDGVIETEDGQPMWQLRYELINRTEWQDPETGETHEVVAPEQRLLFMPVRYD